MPKRCSSCSGPPTLSFNLMMNSVTKTFSSLTDSLTLKLSSNKNLLNLQQLKQTHAQIIANGLLNSSIPLLADLLSSCCRTQNQHYAMQILLPLPKPHPPLWNSMIRVSLEFGNYRDFVVIYNGLRSFELVPNTNAFSLILRFCSGLDTPKLGEAFHCQMMILGFECDLILQSGLLDYYAKFGELVLARRVFVEMPERDVVANNTMIAAFGKYGCVEKAKELFDCMPERDACSWNSMITCYCKVGDVSSARLFFDLSPRKNVISWNAMIAGYCKSGRLRDAEELFVRMGEAKNAVTWNTMIAGFVHSGEFGRAIYLFQKMQAENVQPTEVTMVSLLSACAHLGALDMGEWIDTFIRRKRLRLDVVLGNALIDMYWKCGSIEAALDVFHGLQVKNIFCWNSIIVGLGMYGYGKEALDIFVSMERDGIKPDGVTFVGLLCACSHSGLVHEGRSYFSKMHSLYGVEPAIEHYGCMVDLLGRSGFLEEAVELIKTMPMEPNTVIWGSLLRACQIHKDTEIGEKVTQNLLELDPRDGGNYVFLSNLYASLGRWNDVNVCRKIMMERGAHKTSGCSSIEVDNVVHQFLIGDTSHPQFLKIHSFMDEIEKELESYGYEPDTTSILHDIDEEETESAVR